MDEIALLARPPGPRDVETPLISSPMRRSCCGVLGGLPPLLAAWRLALLFTAALALLAPPLLPALLLLVLLFVAVKAAELYAFPVPVLLVRLIGGTLMLLLLLLPAPAPAVVFDAAAEKSRLLTVVKLD